MCVPPDALTVVDPSLCDKNDIFFDSLPDLTETEREYMFFDRLYLTPKNISYFHYCSSCFG